MQKIVNELVDKLVWYRNEPNENSYKEIAESFTSDSDYHWISDYTIAIAKDESKKKISNIMVSEEALSDESTFEFKREHDYWKKLQENSSYKAVIEFSIFKDGQSLAKIEKEGRDLMRSRKEVPVVGQLSFIWLVYTPLEVNLNEIFELYFRENTILVDDKGKWYVGFSEKLKDIDMRNFVSNPSDMYTI